MNTESNGRNSLNDRQEFNRLLELFLNDPLQYARQYVDGLCKYTLQWGGSSKLKIFGNSLALLRKVDAPNSPDYWYARKTVCEVLCRLFYINKGYKGAIDMCEELLSIAEHEDDILSSDKILIHAGMSRLCYAVSDFERAESHFNEAMRLVEANECEYGIGPDLEAIWAFCLMYFRHQKWAETVFWSVKAFNELDGTDQQHCGESINGIMCKAKIYILLSIMCEKQGDKDVAAKYKKLASDLVDEGRELLHDEFIDNPTDSEFEKFDRYSFDYDCQCLSITGLLDENGDHETATLYKNKMNIYDGPAVDEFGNPIEE